MKLHTLAATALLLPLASGALAAEFDGPFAQAGIAFNRNQADIRFPNWFSTDTSQHTANGQLALGYAVSSGPFNLAASVSYLAGKQESGHTWQRYQNTAEVDKIGIELKQSWSLRLEPGYQLLPSTLIHAILGYNQSRGHWQFNRPLFNDRYSGTETFHGWSFGMGVKQRFGSNFYGFAELQQTRYARKTVYPQVNGNTYSDYFQPKTRGIALGVGYNF